jgi:hypothetical protein
MKFRQDITQGGYKILSIHGPSSCGSYYGTVQDDTGAFFTCTWESDGRDNDYPNARGFDLIPLADEPEPSETTELWNYVHSSSKEINALRELVEGALKRMDNIQADYIARVNGLRADYLADQSAVQPSRVDALEERLEKLEESLAKVADDVAFDVEFRLKDLEAGRNLPQTPELGQDSITVSKAEWEAFNLIVETFEHYRRRPTPELRTQLDVAINTLRKLREGK